MLSPLLALALVVGQPTSSAKTHLKEQRAFNVGNASCELKVFDRDRPVPDEKISLTCDHANILNRDLGQAGLLSVELLGQFNSNSVRAAVTFERGLNSTTMVMGISEVGSKITANVIYEHSSHTPAEIFEGGSVILEHVERRFESEEILPGGTNLYRWRDGQYKFVEGFRWKHGASWLDRYCILYKPENCPAERTKTRVLDEYER